MPHGVAPKFFLILKNMNSSQINVHIQHNPYQKSKDTFHRNRTNNLKMCVEPQRTQKSQSHPEEGEWAGGISFPDFTLHYEATFPKKYGIGTKTGAQARGTEQRAQEPTYRYVIS